MGDEEFTLMRELDADGKVLKDRYGNPSPRDIV